MMEFIYLRLSRTFRQPALTRVVIPLQSYLKYLPLTHDNVSNLVQGVIDLISCSYSAVKLRYQTPKLLWYQPKCVCGIVNFKLGFIKLLVQQLVFRQHVTLKTSGFFC